MSIVNRVSLDEASWHASPAWAAAQSAMEAEALSWFEANHHSLRADWDAENDAKPDTWEDDTQPAPPTQPALDDPVSLALLSHLAQKAPGDMSGLALVVGLGTWQRFTGFSTSRMWLYLAELHARFTDPARARLDQAVAAGWSVKSSANSGHPPGTVIWTSPMGREHLRRPRSIGVPRQGSSETADASAPDSARRAPDPWAYDPHLPELYVPKMPLQKKPEPVVDPDDSPPPPF